MDLVLSLSTPLILSIIALFSGNASADTPPAVAEIKPAKVRVSSHLPPWKGFTFDAANLHDGRVDTSWAPAKSDMLGVGQWVEIDLGAYYAIDHIEIAQGLQLMHPTLGDLFCRNNRMDSGTLIFDDGSLRGVAAHGGELSISAAGFYGYNGDDSLISREKTNPIVRKMLLVVGGVFQAVDWTDLAIAEIRVFGVPAVPHPVPKGDLMCDRPGTFEIKTAILNYCSTLNAKEFGNARCEYIGSDVANCKTQRLPGGMAPTERLPIGSPAAVARGEVTVEMRTVRERHQLQVVRSDGDRWVVKAHAITDEAGRPVIPRNVPYEAYYGDSAKDNPCWDRLKKKRPPYEEGASCTDHGGSEDGDSVDDDTDSVPPAENKNARP